MRIEQRHNNRPYAILLAIVAFALTGFANADPPTRVARIGYVNGPVSFSPAGEDDWVEATLNRPLVTGDRLWADAGARVELQIGAAAIRLGAGTSVTLLNLDDRVAQFQLSQGTLNVRVRRLNPDQVIEIDTPNLAYVMRKPGHYRVSVDANGDATQVSTSSGQAAVYGEGASYAVDAGKSYRFLGTGLQDYEYVALPSGDEFDRWAQERDRSYDNSISARYVSPDVIGGQDLDAYGSWSAVPEYGNVWRPTRVSADWAPYRDGHWAWVDPWGWTWVDDAPWGFAVSHYGRWAHIGGSWGWIPGPVAARAVYAPALVAFIGGSNFSISIASGNVGAVGWFPLGPRDVYRPAYPVSQRYFNNVNVTNTVINTTNITNVYNNPNTTNVTYANRQVQGAVVTVPTTAFVQSQPVARAAVRVPQDAVARASVTPVAAVAPVQASVRGAAPQGAKPPAQVLDRAVIAKSAPPAAPVAFAARERAMASNPGKPIDPSALATMRPATPAPAPKVAVVAPTRTAGPVVAPPPQAAKTDARKADQRGQPATTGPAAQAPAAAPPTSRGATPPPAMAPAPAQAPPPEQRNRPDTRGQPPAPAAAPPAQRASPPVIAPAPAQPPVEQRKPDERTQPPAPVATPPAQRASPPIIAPAPAQPPPEQRGKPETRGQPPAPVAAPPVQRAAPPTPAAAPAQPPPEQRGKPEARGQPPAPVAPPPVQRVAPPTPAPAPAQPPPEQRGRPEARGQPPAPVAAPPVARPPAEQQRAPAPSAPPAAAPVARPPEPARAGPPPSAPPPKGEQRGKDPRPPGDKKGNEKDEEPVRK